MKKLFALAVGLLAVTFLIYGSTVDATITSMPARYAALGADANGPSGTYKLDKAHSFIGFHIQHMGLIDVPGFFRDFTGTINYNAADIKSSSVEFTAKATSVDTGVAARDKHLRTADFFDVEKFPDLTFKSTKVEKKGKKLIISGDLTMHGVTRPITFPFAIAGFLAGEKDTRMGITAETVLNRRDFGINYGKPLPNGVNPVSDNVRITLQLEAIGPKGEAAAAK